MGREIESRMETYWVVAFLEEKNNVSLDPGGVA
jgi:hypothetical protein